MPCIFSKEQKRAVWTMWTKLGMNRNEMAQALHTDVSTIDAIMLSNAKTAEPKLIYKKTKHPVMLERGTPTDKPLERPKAEYSNTNYQNLYLD